MRPLLATLVVTVGACTTHPIYDHPQNPQIQGEIRQVVKEVRNLSGEPLYERLRQLVAYDVFSVDEVTKLCRDPNPRLRSNAMWVLGQIGDPNYEDIERRILTALRRGSRDADRIVRYEAASGLLLHNHWDAIPILLEGLADPEPGISHNCNVVLTQVTSRNFGFDIDAPPEERMAAVQRWRDWYKDWHISQG